MRKIFFTLILILLLATVSASIVNFNFGDTASDITKDMGVIYADSLVLQIQTYTRSLCRYSSSVGTSFDFMTGTFDDNFEIIHKKTLTNLYDGVHRYFVKCRDITDLNNHSNGIAELEAIFRTSSPIAAQVVMEGTTINSGKYEVSLVTTKIPSTTPKLSYSYDGISYSPIILHGGGTSWKGFLIIPKSTGEKVGSFKFEATDLEGRAGNKIVSGDIFSVDTLAPSAISNIEAIGEYKQIRLDWFSDNEDTESINIYRSTSPGINNANFYKTITTDKDYYSDQDVLRGQMYYYRISQVDFAGNLATLSPEVSAMTRKDNNTVTTGLSGELISLVDALLTEIVLLEGDIDNAEEILEDKSDSEKELLKTIGITDEISGVSSELTALEREIVNLKLQNLNSDTLNTRLASSRIKLNIIRKKVPTSIATVDSLKKEIRISEEDVRSALVEYSGELTPSGIDKSVKQSFKMMEENNLEITSEITVFETIYLDGSKSIKSIIKHSVSSLLEKSQETSLLLKLPSSINSDSVKIKNMDYSEEKYGLFRFDTDVKIITYILNEKVDVQILNKIILSPIQIIEDSGMLTGYFLSEIPDSGSLGMTLLVLMACSLVVYLAVMKRKQQSHSITSFVDKAQKVKGLQKKGKLGEANSLYSSLQLDYVSLSDEEKSKVFSKISHLHKK